MLVKIVPHNVLPVQQQVKVYALNVERQVLSIYIVEHVLVLAQVNSLEIVSHILVMHVIHQQLIV